MGNQVTALDALLDLAHPVKRAAAAWAAEHLAGLDGEFSPAAWRAAAGRGIQGLVVPEELGGGGRSLVEALLVFEGLGLGCADNGLVFALASQVFAMQRAFVGAASPAQRERWLPGLLSGDVVGAFAMTEPNAGSDSNSITTSATALTGGGYRLEGTKAWVTLGPLCDVAVVFATTDPALGRWGITAFVVDMDTPGVTRGPAEAKLGLGSCPFGTLSFAGCEVGADAVLGNPGAGAAIFSDAVEAERAFLYAAQLGAIERVLDAAVRRARDRRQFGSPIGPSPTGSQR
jgi:hypothetical protein